MARTAASPVLHHAAALEAVVNAAVPEEDDLSLDVACGPGTVVIAFAGHVRHATGLDSTPAMLDQAAKLAGVRDITNVSWQHGDVDALPYESNAFDIVSCRFAFHHFERPAGAFAEMARVCRPGGRVVLCDAVASDDPAKAPALNDMERFRDPSTVEFRTFGFLKELFRAESLPEPTVAFYQVPIELEALLRVSFPIDDDRDGLRRMIAHSVEGDRMGIHAQSEGATIRFAYTAAILVSVKP